MIDGLSELRSLVMRAENKMTETGIPRVAMVKGEISEHQLGGMYEPMINLVLQGGKTLSIGERTIHFDPASYFVMSVDVPATGVVHQGGPDKPYLAVALTLSPSLIASMLIDLPDQRIETSSEGFSVCPVTPELIDAWLRMMRLMDRAQEIPILAPLIEREILFRVLNGPQGFMLRQIAKSDSYLSHIRKAISWIRAHMSEPFHVEQLAELSGLSPSAFHRHFKVTTAMSPIQYQKRMRLLEARKLLLSGAQSATSVAFEIGYESASQFSREYSRMFGLPPAKDASMRSGRMRGQRFKRKMPLHDGPKPNQ